VRRGGSHKGAVGGTREESKGSTFYVVSGPNKKTKFVELENYEFRGGQSSEDNPHPARKERACSLSTGTYTEKEGGAEEKRSSFQETSLEKENGDRRENLCGPHALCKASLKTKANEMGANWQKAGLQSQKFAPTLGGEGQKKNLKVPYIFLPSRWNSTLSAKTERRDAEPS